MNTKYTQMGTSSIDNAQTSIGARLRLFLKLRNWTIKEFSKETGIPYRSLQNYLSDERKPNAEHLERLFKIGLDPTWVISGWSQLNILGGNGNHQEFGVFIADGETLKIIQRNLSNIVDSIQNDIFEKEHKVVKFTSLIYIYNLAMKYSVEAISKLSSEILEMRRAFPMEYILDVVVWQVVLTRLNARFTSFDSIPTSVETSSIEK